MKKGHYSHVSEEETGARTIVQGPREQSGSGGSFHDAMVTVGHIIGGRGIFAGGILEPGPHSRAPGTVTMV